MVAAVVFAWTLTGRYMVAVAVIGGVDFRVFIHPGDTPGPVVS